MANKFPALFVAHGSPMVAIEETTYARFLDDFAKTLPKPKAIVIFSAHWESSVQTISDVDEYSTIYDFSGFPQELYRITYPAKGDANLVREIQGLLQNAGVPSETNGSRGLDHGAWTILKRIYPNADIPVIALSVNQNLTPAEQFHIGQALSPLRENGVLIIGSGVTVHNFQLISMRNNMEVRTAVQKFEGWLADKLDKWDLDAIFNYRQEAPYADVAVPANGKEHFAPLLYAMGAAGDDSPRVESLHLSWLFNVMTNSVYQFN